MANNSRKVVPMRAAEPVTTSASYKALEPTRNYWKFQRAEGDAKQLFPPFLLYLPKEVYAEEPKAVSIAVAVTL